MQKTIIILQNELLVGTSRNWLTASTFNRVYPGSSPGVPTNNLNLIGAIMFLFILAAHWLGDFVIQTHRQAANKSKRLDALLEHIVTYTLTMALSFSAILIFTNYKDLQLIYYNCFIFSFITFVTHLVTDFITSRITSKLFRKAMDRINANQNPSREFHNFFVVVGLDQLIHTFTLYFTILYLGYQIN